MLNGFYFSAGKNVKTKEVLIPEAAQTVWKIFFPYRRVSHFYVYMVMTLFHSLMKYLILFIGFGVCCSIVLTEGGSSSLNQSYMVQDASTTVAQGTMQYSICPCSADVCRIRFDFTVGQLSFISYKNNIKFSNWDLLRHNNIKISALF